MINLRQLPVKELIKAARAADAALADEVVRVRAADDGFRRALDWALTVEAEQDRRKTAR